MKYADETMDLDGRGISVARGVSRLTPAPLINLYVGIIIAFGSPTGIGPLLNSWSVLLVVVSFMVILPVAPIVLEAWKGHIDLDVSVQEMRAKFFLNAIFFYIIAYLIFALTNCFVMMVLSAAYIMVTVGVMFSTMKSKVSVHGAGIGGPSTALFYIYGIIATPVVLLWILVIWARTTLKQHTLTQSILGLAIGIIITVITYELLWM